ncbi:MAG TPA: LysE family transporter [Desulfobacterales bacterium]|nr:LysE family transporter [Desulfobacterales bacterium]
MDSESVNFFSTFWMIFSFSFLVALTGALTPGPLLTYTIIKSAETQRRGYLMGLWIILGHAILEMAIVLFLLLGFSFVLTNLFVVRTIGIAGGFLLIFFGISTIRNVYLGKISTRFPTSLESENRETVVSCDRGFENPIVGGIMVSMSNPYWWVWWATIGLAFMTQFGISFKQWPRLVAFFMGHEAGDLVWYLIVSVLSFWGLQRLNKKVYYGILICCGIFMILFGVYMGVTPFV